MVNLIFELNLNNFEYNILNLGLKNGFHRLSVVYLGCHCCFSLLKCLHLLECSSPSSDVSGCLMLNQIHRADLRWWWLSRRRIESLKLFIYSFGDSDSSVAIEFSNFMHVAPCAKIHLMCDGIFSSEGYFEMHIHKSGFYCNFDICCWLLLVYCLRFASGLLMDVVSCCLRSSCWRDFLGWQLDGCGFLLHLKFYSFLDSLGLEMAFSVQIGWW